MREASLNPWSQVIRHGFSMPPINPNTPWSEAASAAIMALANHLRNSATVREYLAELKKGPGTLCPDSSIDELVKYVAEQNGQIDKTDPTVNLSFINGIMFPMFDLERQYLNDIAKYNLDITAEEEELFRFSVQLAGLVDKLYHRWFNEIAVPYQRMNDDGKATYRDALKDQLDQFDYTVYAYNNGKIVDRKTWAQAFPEEVAAIDDLLDTIRTLGNTEIRNYLKALRRAYNCIDVAALEEYWAAVDEAWIKILPTCRMFPVHGMENGYEHPFGVSPEFRLVIRTNHGQDIISRIRAATPAYARHIGIDEKLVTLAEQKMACIDIGVFTTVVRAGVCANFRYAGQVVPNRQDILVQGGKTFMDIDTTTSATKVYRDLVLKHVAPNASQIIVDMITVNGMLTHTVCHECTHPIGCTPESDATMGEMKYRIEEAKATLGGLAAVINQLDPSGWTEVAATSIARVCRFFTKATYENPTVQPYVRENIAMANLLFAAEIVVFTPKGIVANLEEARLKKWSEMLQQFYRDVVVAYHANDSKQAVAAVEERYCAHTPEINNWIAWVNR